MIQEYMKDDRRFFRVREFARSKTDPSIRREKSKSGIETYTDAKRASKLLLREVQREVLDEEQRGWTWQRSIHEWELAVREGNVFAKLVEGLRRLAKCEFSFLTDGTQNACQYIEGDPRGIAFQYPGHTGA